jgi:hypothetical protein
LVRLGSDDYFQKRKEKKRMLRRAKEMTQISDVSVVRKWDTLLGIVPSFRDQWKIN